MIESKRAECVAVDEHLVAYVDCELSGSELEEVERHVATCVPCRREIADIESVGRLVAALPRVEPTRALAARMQARIDGTVQRRPIRSTRWAVGFAAAAVVVLAIGSMLHRGAAPIPTTRAVGLASVPAHETQRAPVARQAVARRAVADASNDGAMATLASGAADSFEALLPEDLPPDLLERPELYLRLPVVRRLEKLEYFEEVRLYGDHDRVGRAPRALGDRAAWG